MTGGTSLSLALAVLIGLTLGALGGGGSILTLPIFVFVAGIPAQEAVAMSMVVVGGTSLLGSGACTGGKETSMRRRRCCLRRPA